MYSNSLVYLIGRVEQSKPMNGKGLHGFLRVAQIRAAKKARAQTEVCATGPPTRFFGTAHSKEL